MRNSRPNLKNNEKRDYAEKSCKQAIVWDENFRIVSNNCDLFKVVSKPDIIYIKKQEFMLQKVLKNKQDEEKEMKESSRGHIITNNDRLRSCEAMMSDYLKIIQTIIIFSDNNYNGFEE